MTLWSSLQLIEPRRANRENKQQRNRNKLRWKSHQSPQPTNWDPDLIDQQPSTNSSSKAGEDSSTSVGLGASFTTSVSTQPYSQIIPQNAQYKCRLIPKEKASVVLLHESNILQFNTVID